jgi:Uma2 family endonuclease
VSTALRIEDGRVWTFEDLDNLPDGVDWRRFEIVDGALVVSPQATPRHDLVVAELILACARSVPPGYRMIGSTTINLHPSYRVPDVTVLADRVFAADEKRVLPADVSLAVEIESPSSITTDRITKPAQYAAGGIPHYWRIETNPLRLNAYELVGDMYAATGSWAAGEIAQIDQTFPVEFDIAGLLPD